MENQTITPEYLDLERVKLWQELRATQGNLQQVLDGLPHDGKDTDAIIRGIGIKASKAYNRLLEKVAELERLEQNWRKVSETFTENVDTTSRNATIINDLTQKARSNSVSLEESCSSVEGQLESARQVLEEINEAASRIKDEHTSSTEAIESLKILTNQAKEEKERLDVVYADVVGVHRAVFGYTDKDGNRVDGRKQDLEIAYNELADKIETLRQKAEADSSHYKSRCEDFLSKATTEIDSVSQQLKSLLPAAMTAGLSAAYLKKRADEEKEQKSALRLFKWCIFFMVLFAFIPVSISAFFLYNGASVLEVLGMLPKEATCILPLYLPVLWLAVFSNKRVNLSKRLIEEYTHKEVVSKTYEGLSHQISNLGDTPEAEELRARLLYNTVMLSEKNPGELIKNYGNADNPILDVLNQSTKLSESIEKAAQVPGLGRFLRLLDKKESRARKMENAVNTAEDVDSE